MELEERDLQVDRCNEVLQESQTRCAQLVHENSRFKAEVDKFERVMLMQVMEMLLL